VRVSPIKHTATPNDKRKQPQRGVRTLSRAVLLDARDLDELAAERLALLARRRPRVEAANDGA
jgi:hypothetical protein